MTITGYPLTDTEVETLESLNAQHSNLCREIRCMISASGENILPCNLAARVVEDAYWSLWRGLILTLTKDKSVVTVELPKPPPITNES